MPGQRNVTRSHRAYVEKSLAHIQEKRSKPFGREDEERLLAAMASEDELVRADAVRQLCPCSVPDEVFFRLRKAAKRLQKDPSPLVRANAWHIEEDARMVASFEAQAEGLRDRDEMAELTHRSARRSKRPHSPKAIN